MKLSEAVEELIDLKVSGEPEYNEWRSGDYNDETKQKYYARIEELKRAIDAAADAGKVKPADKEDGKQ